MTQEAYEYSDIQGATIRIVDNPNEGVVKIRADEFATWAVLPQRERQAAAEALAGDEYEVVPVPAVNAASILNPADVKVGDVVEVAHDGPPPWRLEGTVIDGPSSGLTLPPHDLWISFKPGGELLMPRDATVRLVRRAEPEPDPAEVEALTETLKEIHAALGNTFTQLPDTARELVRRGVTVGGAA